MQARNLLKINKRAGCKKAVEVGIFQKLIVEKSQKNGKFSKIDKRAIVNKEVQAGIFQKVNNLCNAFV